MNQYYPLLSTTPLFTGFSTEELPPMLACLNAEQRHYQRGEYIFMEGDPASRIGIVLQGNVQVLRDDYMGHRTILTELPAGELFAETFACARIDTMPVSVLAVEDCDILLADYRKVTSTCTSACTFHSRLIANMMALLAEKNLLLNNKLSHLCKRTTREKLLSYLDTQAKKAASRHFTIPFSRQELADYLCVDRSALSSELGRMRDEGLLEFQRSHFTLTSKAADILSNT